MTCGGTKKKKIGKYLKSLNRWSYGGSTPFAVSLQPPIVWEEINNNMYVFFLRLELLFFTTRSK